MRITRIYLDVDLQRPQIELSKDRSHYLRKVLRLVDGAVVRVFDGRGNEREATLDSFGLRLGQFVDALPPPSLPITLLQGISRGERMDMSLQKATELGVSTLLPILTERCEVKLKSERVAKRLAHWEGVISSACEQCGRAELPTIGEPLSLTAALSTLDAANHLTRLALLPGATKAMTAITPPIALAMAVGPEGGFSESESQQLVAAGFIAVQLGPRILRTETAGPAAIAAAQAVWGDFSGREAPSAVR